MVLVIKITGSTVSIVFDDDDIDDIDANGGDDCSDGKPLHTAVVDTALRIEERMYGPKMGHVGRR